MNATLIEALVAQIEANEAISSLFPGGVWNTVAAAGDELPYVTLVKAGSEPTGIIGRKLWLDKITINFQVFAVGGDVAELLVDQLQTLLMQSAPVGWTTGQECGRWLAPGETGQLDEGLGPNGEDVWIQTLPIGFTITRTA